MVSLSWRLFHLRGLAPVTGVRQPFITAWTKGEQQVTYVGRNKCRTANIEEFFCEGTVLKVGISSKEKSASTVVDNVHGTFAETVRVRS